MLALASFERAGVGWGGGLLQMFAAVGAKEHYSCHALWRYCNRVSSRTCECVGGFKGGSAGLAYIIWNAYHVYVLQHGYSHFLLVHLLINCKKRPPITDRHKCITMRGTFSF